MINFEYAGFCIPIRNRAETGVCLWPEANGLDIRRDDTNLTD